MSAPRRYPGPQPFAEAQADIFFGRERAARSLYRLVGQEQLVVVHAKSGVGKSSLIKAGLLPLLRQNPEYLPFEIRLGAFDSEGAAPPLVTIQRVLGEANEGETPAFLGKILPEDDSIWRSLKERQLRQLAAKGVGEEPPTVLLIIDQFEELFTYPPEQQLAFRRQLAEALYTKLPQRYWDMLSLYEGDQAPFTAQEKQWLLRGLRVHVLTAIREDRMHLLGSLSDYLPTISKNWFELQHLDRPAARRAIEAPAAREGNFATAPFTYAEGALTAIIDYLSTGVGGIESTQLQVICDALDRKHAKLGDRTITPAVMGDLKAITAQFYQDKLAEVTDPDQRRLTRKLVEEELLYAQAKRRLSLFSGQIYDYGLRPQTLKTLVDGHLLRAEPDLRGGYNYEISHDSLVEPILKARREREAEEAEAARREREEAAAAERAQREAEQARELEAARERSRRARRLNTILGALLVAAVVAIVFAVIKTKEADKNERIALTERQKAINQANRAEAVLDKIYFYEGEFGLATELVSGSLKFGFINKDLKTKIPFNYEEAQPFDDTGFARVKKNREYYLIDTTGTEFLLATDLQAPNNPDITALDLRGKYLERWPNVWEVYPNLRVVLVKGSNMSDLRPLSGLTSLQTLDLGRTQVSDLGPISGFTSLQSLDLEYTEVSDLAPISGFTSLQTLDLGYTEVSDLGPISGLTSLQTLDLGRTQVSDLVPISGLTSLQTLDLGRTQVSDLVPISGLTSLQSLDLGAQVSDLGPISGLTSLQSLDLVSAPVSDLGPISGLTSLQSLSLSFTEVSDLGPISGLTSLQSLSLSFTEVSDLGPISGLTSLQSLRLDNCKRLSDLTDLSTLTSLRSLRLGSTPVSDLGPISGLTSLQSLSLGNCKRLSDLTDLSTLTSLQALYLRLTPVSDLGPLSGLTSLQSLSLSFTEVSDLGPISDLTSLQTLDLSRTEVSDLGPISGLTSLQSLDLENTQVSDLGPLSGLTSLQTLDLKFCFELNDLTGLSGLTSLHTLFVRGTDLSTESLDAFRKAVPNCIITDTYK